MKQYNYPTLSAFASRADTIERITQARRIINKQQHLEPWQYDSLIETLNETKRSLTRYDN